MKRIILSTILALCCFLANAQYALPPSYCTNATPDALDTYMVKSAGRTISLKESIRVDTEARNLALVWFTGSAALTAGCFISADLAENDKLKPFYNLSKWYTADGTYKEHYAEHWALIFRGVGYFSSAVTAYTGAVFVYEQCRLNKLRKIAVNLNSVTYTF